MDNKQVGGVVNLGGGIDTYTPLENNAKVEIPTARKPLAVTQPVVQPTTTPNLNTNVLDDAKLNAAIDKSINNLSFTPEDTRYIPDLLTIGPKGYKGIKPTAGLEIGQLEEYAASTQTWSDRMWNDSKVAGAGIALGAATAFTSIYDMVKEGTFSPGANSITAGLNNEYAQYTEENRNYENAYDKANPIMSMVLPSFITGSSKGWGELIKSASMGLGTLGGIALQEVLITAATAGTGTFPALALNIKRLINGSETVLQIAKGAGALKAAAQASLGVEKSLKLGNALAKVTPTLRDVRIGLVGAIGESEFEANEARTVMRTKYINDYYEQTGKLPNPEDVAHAEKVGEKAHDFRYALNVATLMLTNDRMLGSLFKPFSSVVKFQDKLIAKNLTSLLDDAGKVIYKDKLLASNVWNRLKYGSEIKNGLEKALPILRSAGTHITLNEGLEEGLQFLYQKGTDNYFTPFLNEKNNESVKESFLNTASGVLAEIYNNKGEVFSTEGLQNIVGGIMGGTLQSIGSYGVNSFGVEKVKSTNKEGKEVSSYKFVNRQKEADELFEEEKIKAGTEIEKSIKDLTAIVMDHKSLNSTPRESISTLNATVHADNIGSQIKDPILYDLQQDQKKFNILLPLAKSGYAEVAIDLLKEQFDSMSDAAFSAYTGVEIKSKAQKDSIVNTITEDFNKVVKAHSTVDANFRHAIKANTEQHARYNLLKDALTYHQYSIENLNSKVNDYQVSSDVTSTDRLMQGFVNKDLAEFQTLRESVTAELSSVSQQIALTVEANKTATVKASTAELNKIQKQLEEKNNLLTETAQLVKNSDDKTVKQIVKNIHKLGGNEKEADDIQANKILTEALSYKTLKDTYTHHVDTFNKLLYTETKDLDDTFLDFMNEASETNDLVFEILGQLVKTEEQNRRGELIKKYNLSKKSITKLEQLEASRPNANTEDLIKQILEEDKQEIEEARLKAEEAEKLRLEAELEASKKSKVHSPKTKKDFFALVPILTDDHIVKIGGLPFSVKVDEEYDAIDFNSDEGLAFALAISTKDITDMTETEGPVLDALNLFFNDKAKPVPTPVPVPVHTPIETTLPDFKVKTKQYEDWVPTIESKAEAGSLELIVNEDGTVMWTPVLPNELNDMSVAFINKRPYSKDLRLGIRVLNVAANEKPIAEGDTMKTGTGQTGLIEKGLNFNLSNLDKKPIYTVYYTFTEGQYAGRTIEIGSFRDEKAFQVSSKSLGWLAVKLKNNTTKELQPFKELLDRQDVVSWNELLTAGLPFKALHNDILTALYGVETPQEYLSLQSSMARAADNYNSLPANPTIDDILKDYEVDQVNLNVLAEFTDLDKVGANSFIINGKTLSNVIRVSNLWYSYNGTSYELLDPEISDELSNLVPKENKGSITLAREKTYNGPVSYYVINLNQSPAFKTSVSQELNDFLKSNEGVSEIDILKDLNSKFLIKGVTDESGEDLFNTKDLGSFKFDTATGTISRIKKGATTSLFEIYLDKDNLYKAKISGNIVDISINRRDPNFIPKIEDYVSTGRTKTNKLLLVKRTTPIKNSKAAPVAHTPVDILPEPILPQGEIDKEIVWEEGVSKERQIEISAILKPLSTKNRSVRIQQFQDSKEIRFEVPFRDLFVNVQEEITRIKTNCY